MNRAEHYTLTVHCQPAYVLVLWQVMQIKRDLLGIVTIPKIDRDEGAGYIETIFQKIPEDDKPLRSYLKALVFIGLAISYDVFCFEDDGEAYLILESEGNNHATQSL